MTELRELLLTEDRTADQDARIIMLLAEFRARERVDVAEPVEYEGGSVVPLSRSEQAECNHSNWANRVDTSNKWKEVCVHCGKSRR